jgi:hypothetical protein
MKTKKALLAQNFTLEEAIKALEAKGQNTTWTDHTDGSFSVSVPITVTDMKQMSELRAELNKTDSLLGQKKSSTRKASAVQAIKDPDLLTEQMLAERWRAANTDPAYLKIGGKVLYRQEDIIAYEAAHLVKTESKS